MKHYLMRSGQRVTVREANEDDAAAIEYVVNSVASEKYYIVPERSREDWDEVIKQIKDRRGLIIVAQVDGKTVGMAHLVRGRLEKSKHVGFLGISVLRGSRRIGIGKAMMNYMIEWAERQEELEKVSLTVFSTNKAAINLYRRFGFNIEGTSKKQYKIEGRHIDVNYGKILDLAFLFQIANQAFEDQFSVAVL
jgi:ribosomal protein S18 acetylase RimI-like enzyme